MSGQKSYQMRGFLEAPYRATEGPRGNHEDFKWTKSNPHFKCNVLKIATIWLWRRQHPKCYENMAKTGSTKTFKITFEQIPYEAGSNLVITFYLSFHFNG